MLSDKIMDDLRQFYRTVRRYYKESKASKSDKIKLYNCSVYEKGPSDNWLYQFIQRRKILKDHSKDTLGIFSVNGERIVIDFNPCTYKLFYTIENVHVQDSHWQKYEDLLLNKKSVNLSLGFDYIDHEKYIRFPYWLMTVFKPEDDYNAIKQKCAILNNPAINLHERKNFCSLICRKDYFDERIKIYNQISQIGQVDCDGEFMHNNYVLKTKFNDDKSEFLKTYRFNLCPENSNYKGYVTEKIFDAIQSGCIPIYWGSENNPEPGILNHNAILFSEINGNNDLLIKEINILDNNPHLYQEFAGQKRLIAEAPEIIFDHFIKLENRLRKIIKEY